MTIRDMIEQSKEFAEEVIRQLSDKDIPQNKRQVYFMDNNDRIKKCMTELKMIINELKPERTASEEGLQLMNNARAILEPFQKAITEFQKELMIDENVQEEDLERIPGINPENVPVTIEENNVVEDVTEGTNYSINNTPEASYTHCLMCDGTPHLFFATTKQNINKFVNSIVDAESIDGEVERVELFEISFTPIPLNKKIVLSV